MLKYLIVLLDSSAPSFCHYDIGQKAESRDLMPLDILKKAIFFSMKENLNVQLVWPNYILPDEYLDLIETVDHINIVPSTLTPEADVVLVGSPTQLNSLCPNQNIVLRCSMAEFIDKVGIVAASLDTARHISVVINDIQQLDESVLPQYESALIKIADHIASEYSENRTPSLNILTDRMFLKEMNNCNAGWEAVAIAPDGKFYACPAFYYTEHPDSAIGNIDDGLSIANPQLYRLSHAPICSHCDAWHCKRCVWLLST